MNSANDPLEKAKEVLWQKLQQAIAQAWHRLDDGILRTR